MCIGCVYIWRIERWKEESVRGADWCFSSHEKKRDVGKKNPTQILIFLPRSLNQGLASVRCFFLRKKKLPPFFTFHKREIFVASLVSHDRKPLVKNTHNGEINAHYTKRINNNNERINNNNERINAITNDEIVTTHTGGEQTQIYLETSAKRRRRTISERERKK